MGTERVLISPSETKDEEEESKRVLKLATTTTKVCNKLQQKQQQNPNKLQTITTKAIMVKYFYPPSRDGNQLAKVGA
jgi:hypothetical protein